MCVCVWKRVWRSFQQGANECLSGGLACKHWRRLNSGISHSHLAQLGPKLKQSMALAFLLARLMPTAPRSLKQNGSNQSP